MEEAPAPGAKVCSRCRGSFPYDQFYSQKGKLDPWCKDCRKAQAARSAAHYPERTAITKALSGAKRRAKTLGIPFTITREDITPVPKECPALGMPMVIGREDRGNSPSLDRLVPEHGYVPGNVRWISMRANTIKSNATPHELLSVALWLQREMEEYWNE